MGKKKLVFSALLILSFIFGTYFRFELTDYILIKDWNSRDFDRAFKLIEGHYIPLAGPEVNVGGRLPGPFLYFLLTIPLFIHKAYESIFYFNFLLNIGSVVGFYFVLRKFFDYFSCAIATILALFCLPHMGAVGFPINPSFLFPFIVLFIWAYLEFVLNKKDHYVPLMVLAISLGIQLHYSILIFAFIPLILKLLWRIKIGPKPLWWGGLIGILSFTPYIIYKVKFFQALGEGIPTFSKHTLSTLLQIPFLSHTLTGITLKNGLWRYQLFPKEIAWFFLILTVAGLSVLLFTIFKKTRKDGIHICKKEISLFLLFYFTGLVFEVSQAFRGHFPHNWYSYVLLFPQMMVISYFFLWIEESLKERTGRIIFYTCLFVSFLFLLSNAHQEVLKYKTESIKNLFSKNFKLRRYKEYSGYANLLKTFMEKLNLSPEEYFQRVYFEGLGMNGGPQSLKLLQLIYKNSNVSKVNITSKNCFYIRNLDFLGATENIRFKFFQGDKSISQKRNLLVVVPDGSITRRFVVTEYTPNINQSCYNNTFNKYVVENDIRDLLLDSHDIKPESKLEIKIISLEEEFDSISQLKHLKGNYLIYLKDLMFPFRLKLEMNRTAGGYLIKSSLLFYRFHVQTHHISKLVVNLNPKLEISLLSPKSLPTYLGASNQFLFKEFNLLQKEPFLKGQNTFYLFAAIHSNSVFYNSKSNLTSYIKIPLNGKKLREFAKSKNYASPAKP